MRNRAATTTITAIAEVCLQVLRRRRPRRSTWMPAFADGVGRA